MVAPGTTFRGGVVSLVCIRHPRLVVALNTAGSHTCGRCRFFNLVSHGDCFCTGQRKRPYVVPLGCDVVPNRVPKTRLGRRLILWAAPPVVSAQQQNGKPGDATAHGAEADSRAPQFQLRWYVLKLSCSLTLEPYAADGRSEAHTP